MREKYLCLKQVLDFWHLLGYGVLKTDTISRQKQASRAILDLEIIYHRKDCPACPQDTCFEHIVNIQDHAHKKLRPWQSYAAVWPPSGRLCGLTLMS